MLFADIVHDMKPLVAYGISMLLVASAVSGCVSATPPPDPSIWTEVAPTVALGDGATERLMPSVTGQAETVASDSASQEAARESLQFTPPGAQGTGVAPTSVRLNGVQPIKPAEVAASGPDPLGPFDCGPVDTVSNTVRCTYVELVNFTIYETIVDEATMEMRFQGLKTNAIPTSTSGVLCSGPTFGDPGGGMACFEQVGNGVYVVVYDTYLNSMGADTVASLTYAVARSQ